VRNGAGFRGGGRAQLPSLPVDDPLTSDQKGVYSAYTQRSNTPGSEAVFYFFGNQATWYGPKSEEYGMANVYLDGELVGKVDQFAAEPKNVAPIFTISDLPRSSHVLTIEVANEKNENASDNYIAIDAFEES